MPRKRWSEEQIIYAVKQSEAGKKAADICRELGVSEQTFYTWNRWRNPFRVIRRLEHTPVCAPLTSPASC